LSRIEATFNELSARRAALVTYMMGGYPTLERSLDIAGALIDGGTDILEIGVPFSDPIADGPIIQSAAKKALETGASLRRILGLCRAIREQRPIPTVVMGYLNPIYQMGYERFFEEASTSGVDGVIIPDMPLEESNDLRSIAQAHGIDVIFLAAPSTSPTRLSEIASRTSGFLYLVSVYGVTGPRRKISMRSLAFIKRAVHIISDQVPVSVGFGVSKPEQVKKIVKTGANGVVVGSSLINELLRMPTCSKDVLNRLRNKTRKLKQATVLLN
jgi:tryptophan synthase alpha chain